MGDRTPDRTTTPAKGERWDCRQIPRTCRVMADPIEGYVMARFKGAMPFLIHVNDWHRKFVRQGAAASLAEHEKE